MMSRNTLSKPQPDSASYVGPAYVFFSRVIPLKDYLKACIHTKNQQYWTSFYKVRTLNTTQPLQLFSLLNTIVGEQISIINLEILSKRGFIIFICVVGEN